MNKIYASAAEALAGIVKDGQTIAVAASACAASRRR